MVEKLSHEAEAAAAWAVQDGVPAGGVVTGIVVAMAASLVSVAAERSRAAWPGAPGAIGQAEALRRRADALVNDNSLAYGDARAALAGGGPASAALAGRGVPAAGGGVPDASGARDWAIGRAVAAAADPPLALAACASDVAQLALALAEHGAPEVRPDLVVAAELAAGAAASAAHLVEVNLVVGAEERRTGQARSHAQAAARAARAAASAS